ncbi:MAG: DUF1848 domain-containing protein [Firmicutes bacterium]|nr:DUF1848 domain-containing protein [Bacillota bacterium]
MILSASRRTDIPAFYADWLLNRLRAGYALARNPMNHAQIRRVPTSRDAVDCVAFWTKDPLPLLPRLPEIDRMGHRYYFQFTLTPYDRTLEKNLRDKDAIVKTFVELSKRCPVLWRYDPIILNDRLDIAWHAEQFNRLCEKLHRHTPQVTISFVILYPKLKTPLIRRVTEDEIAELAGRFAEIAGQYGLPVKACCEKTDLSPYGIRRASCIDRTTVEALCGCKIAAPQDKNQRPSCGCLASVDIGVYNTCGNGCVYCYANHSAGSAAANTRRHDPAGELLMGELTPGEKIVTREARSWKEEQLSLFT